MKRDAFKAFESSEYAAAPAAGLRVVISVDQTIKTEDKERKVLAFIWRRDLRDRNHTDTMTLQTQQR